MMMMMVNNPRNTGEMEMVRIMAKVVGIATHHVDGMMKPD